MLVNSEEAIKISGRKEHSQIHFSLNDYLDGDYLYAIWIDFLIGKVSAETELTGINFYSELRRNPFKRK